MGLSFFGFLSQVKKLTNFVEYDLYTFTQSFSLEFFMLSVSIHAVQSLAESAEVHSYLYSSAVPVETAVTQF